MRGIWGIFCGLAISVSAAQAQDMTFPLMTEPLTMSVAPSKPAEVPTGPVVVELFTSQACAFCPPADKLFAELVAQNPQVIGLACHIDYFTVQTGSLAQSFCTDRQSWYERALAVGANYTPQMIVQGRLNVVGYKDEDVKAALARAPQELPITLLEIVAADEAGHYIATVPVDLDVMADTVETTLMLYDKPHDVTIADGRNKDQAMHYPQVVSALETVGPWDSAQLDVAPDAKDTHQGFVLLVQDKATGHILAAGKYEF